MSTEPESLTPLLNRILDEYALPLSGVHGPKHWGRVLENGLRLSELTGADVTVVRLFAVLHDSQRITETFDPDHGPRAAEFAESLRGELLCLPDQQFSLLYRACHDHTTGTTHPDITIQTCWDADRLDLGRVGIRPHPSRLCTDAAKQTSMINWADGRASFEVTPDCVTEEWGLDEWGRRSNDEA